MEMKVFTREVAHLLPAIHIELVKKQPDFLLKGKMTFPQMILLNILGAQKECKMSDLARILGVTKSAVTGLTDRLIKAGLLQRTRSKKDRRIVNVALTLNGLNQARRLSAFRLKMISSLFSNINQKDRIQYLNILRKVHKNILSKAEYKYYG